MLNIADISTWQPNVDYGAFIRGDGDGFVCKVGGANGGSLYQDSRYDQHTRGVREAGGLLGHYWMNGSVAVSRCADFFLKSLKRYQPGDPIVLDCEAIDGDRAWYPGEVNEFFDLIRPQVDGLNAFVYMNDLPMGAHDWSDLARRGVRLWKAEWDSSPSSGDWPDWTIWQYTDTGVMSGFKGDLNKARDDAWRSSVLIDAAPEQIDAVLARRFDPIGKKLDTLASSL